MSARSSLFLLLVVSLIGIIFALIPATEAQTSFNIEQISQQITDTESEITINVNNSYDNEVTYSLSIDIFSKDLQDSISIDNPTKIFSLDSMSNNTANFSYLIPVSGNHTFNFTLLENNQGVMKTYYLENNYFIYQKQNINLQGIVEDNYPDLNGQTKWQYNEYDHKIEVVNLDEQYNTSIVLGPFNTSKKSNNLLEMQTSLMLSDTAQYTISYSDEFDKEQLYRTDWEEIYTVSESGDITIVLDLIKDEEIFIKLESKDTEGDDTNYWEITSINHLFNSIKHDLQIRTEEHYFYNIEQKPELLIDIENRGIFDQEMGNISIIVHLYYKDNYFDSYSKSLAIDAGETETIDFSFLTADDPGNYYCIIETTILQDEIFYDIRRSFISFSTLDLGASELKETTILETTANSVNLLIEIEDYEILNFNSENETVHLFDNYYIVEIINLNDNLIIQTGVSENYGRIISAIVMDEYKFNAFSEEEADQTTEGILAPTIIFEKQIDYYANLIIDNEGFHDEEYVLTYLFASTFVKSVEGPNKIIIKPNEQAIVGIKIEPFEDIPRNGGSQLNIEITNQGISKIVTYVLSYKATEIAIVDSNCDRSALLTGQELNCDSIITNQGYRSGKLSITIGATIQSQAIIIDDIEIGKLDNSESWTLRSNFAPENEGKYTIFVEVRDESGIVTSYQSEKEVNVIQATSEMDEPTSNFQLPKVSLGPAIFTMSLIGVGYQFNRSENFKYLAFKFFMPLYSRLQKDTLADEPTRQNLLQHIYSTPGSNFKQLKERFDLHNGTLAHHINILENHNMITSHRSGRQRLFFPFGNSNRLETRAALITNKTQKEIVDIVKQNPGITQSMISQHLAVSRQKINYHVNSLASKAYLKIEKQGRITRLYPSHFT